MKIKVLGTGCPNCIKLYNNVTQAVQDLNIEGVEIIKIEEIDEIIAHGVLSTPALIINDEVKSSSYVPKIEEIKEMLKL